MPLAALALIVVAAFLHAGWNLLAKRAGGGAVFVWLLALASSVLYAPVAAVLLVAKTVPTGIAIWLCIFGSALLHVAYFVSLQRGYRAGDLSLVYPLARGTGPLVAAVAAVVLFGEQPGILAVLGAGLIIAGVFMISGGTEGLRSQATPYTAILYGLCTGIFISGYTLVDKYGVSFLHVPPLIYHWLANIGIALIMVPYVCRRPRSIGAEWSAHWPAILGVAVMSPLAYILVLTAMQSTPVSYVAPAREISILIGVVMGARLLSEGQTATRLSAAAAIVVGVVALTLD